MSASYNYTDENGFRANLRIEKGVVTHAIFAPNTRKPIYAETLSKWDLRGQRKSYMVEMTRKCVKIVENPNAKGADAFTSPDFNDAAENFAKYALEFHGVTQREQDAKQTRYERKGKILKAIA